MFATDHPLLADVESLMHRLARGAGDEPVGRIAAEHLGTGGKRLRARLALATMEAAGGDPASAVGWGAACELFHNATLIHDDIQDGDRVRRGQPAAWVRHGVPQAINAGDLLFVLPLDALAAVDSSHSVRAALAGVLARHGAVVIRGQGLELEMHRTMTIDRATYLRAIASKTSALFEMPVDGAARIAGVDAPRVSGAFRELGILFQIQDDVLDLFGDKGREAPGADLKEGKISALVVEHVERFPDERQQVIDLLRRPREETRDDAVAEAIRCFKDGGALRAVLDDLQVRRERALSELDGKLRELWAGTCEVILAPIAHLM